MMHTQSAVIAMLKPKKKLTALLLVAFVSTCFKIVFAVGPDNGKHNGGSLILNPAHLNMVDEPELPSPLMANDAAGDPLALRDPAIEQLREYKQSKPEPDCLTTSLGVPIGSKSNILTVGERGPALLQDLVFIEEQAHFNRERIPERVVHAKGAGAHGYFEVTHDITQYTKAKLFSHLKKKTKIFARFSVAGSNLGTADTARSHRGFAIKFYTEEGNWDLTGANSPVFFNRDAIHFPSMVRSLKYNPRTNLQDADQTWDFFSMHAATTHQVVMLFTNRFTPDGYRYMHGFGANTFKLVNSNGHAHYCKFHYLTNQGIKNLNASEAARIAGIDPEYARRDLYNAIASGDFPSWTLYIQAMTFEKAEKLPFNPFDVTKVWPHKEFPLIPVGRIVLDRNPTNFFAEVEQGAFSPSHLIPGIEPSPDKNLQGRLFAYPDAHRYRLGVNSASIPINCPFMSPAKNYQRDGKYVYDGNQGDAPNYFPNSFSGPIDNTLFLESKQHFAGDIARYNTSDDDNFSQPGHFWRTVLKEHERAELVDNIVSSLQHAEKRIQKRVVQNFNQVDPDFGRRVHHLLMKSAM